MQRQGRFPRSMRRMSSNGALTLLGAETQGVAIDFTDMSMLVRDTTTPANNFSGNPNNKLTYSSPSTKYVLGADGRLGSGTTLRRAYDGSGSVMGLLTEEPRTNVTLFSNTFSDASWTRDNVTLTAPSVMSIDGSATTQMVTPNAVLGQHRLIATGVATTGSQAMSYFVRPNGYTKVAIREGVATGGYAAFDLTGAGSVLDQSAGTGAIVAYPNGWYRIIFVATVTGTCRPDLWILDPAYTTGVVTGNWSGNTTSGVYVYNEQTEAGTFATSPIVTSGSTVTRAADKITQATGTFYAPNTGGTLFVLAVRIQDAINYPPLVSIAGADFNDSAQIARYVSQRVGASVRVGAAIQADSASGAIITSVAPTIKAAYGYAAGDFALYVNGAQIYTDAVGTLPTAGTLGIARVNGDAGSQESIYIQKIAHLPRRMSNAELQALST